MKLPSQLAPESVIALVDTREQLPLDLMPLRMEPAIQRSNGSGACFRAACKQPATLHPESFVAMADRFVALVVGPEANRKSMKKFRLT
jgi:hypothetical protein